MFALAPDARADNARQALALPGLPENLRVWLKAIVLHNLVVAGRTDQAVAEAMAARAAAEASPTAESRFAIELAESGLDYQLFRFSLALQRLDAAARVGGYLRRRPRPPRLVLPMLGAGRARSFR